jgi:hypothetical protein
VCKLIATSRTQYVRIKKANQADVSKIIALSREYEEQLKRDEGKNTEPREQIYRGSEAMALYIIGKARDKGCVITGVKLDTYAFTVNKNEKRDIIVELKKDGEKMFDNYSLKLYTDPEISLVTTSPVELINKLIGSAAAQEASSIFERNADLQRYLSLSQELTNFIKQEKVDKEQKARLEDERKILRNKINPMFADVMYDILEKYHKKDPIDFAERLLKMIGFDNEETKLLIAIAKRLSNGMKVSIIDKHPELDLRHVNIEHNYGSTAVRIKDIRGRVIITFKAKEGERKNVSGSMLFSKKAEVDLDDYQDLAKKLGVKIK